MLSLSLGGCTARRPVRPALTQPAELPSAQQLLANFAARVTLLVRGQSLAAGMSDYLIKQLKATRNVEVRLNTRRFISTEKKARHLHVFHWFR